MENQQLEILLVLLLILANGFFAAAEIAIIAARRTQVRQQAEAGNRRASLLHKLQNDPERFLAAIQIGITLIGSLAGAVGGVFAIRWLEPVIANLPIPAVQAASGPIAVGIAVLLIAYLSLVLGELVPKNLALRYPEAIAYRVSGPIDRLARISAPFISLLVASSRLFLRPFGAGVYSKSLVTEEEIKMMVREGQEKGVFDTTEQELIHSVFEFTDKSVKEVMVARPKIHALQVDTPAEEALRYMAENKFSRYPVYTHGLNDICGMVYYKDFLAALTQQRSSTLRELLHPAYFVPETMKVSHLLQELQRRRLQIAVVVNEYGSVEGIATMEDLIEEIVGEIHDEYDIEERPVERLKDGSLVVDASLSVRDLREDYHLDVPESEDYETLGGFVLAKLQGIPRGGEIIQHDAMKFTIVDMDGRRIARVKVEKAIGTAEGPIVNAASRTATPPAA